MAPALARPAMKGGAGGSDKKQVRSRLLSVAVGCFLLFVVLTLSCRYNATFVVDNTRRVDFRPSSKADTSHGGEGELKQLAQQSNGKEARITEAEVEEESLIREQSNGVVGREAELELELEETEHESSATANATSNSDEQAKPAAEDADPEQDKSRTAAAAGATAQPVVQATSPQHQNPGDMAREAAAPSMTTMNQQRQPLCDLSGSRADVCDLTGDIRLDATNASSFSFTIVVDPTAAPTDPTTYKVRPYARKGDATSMNRVTEFTVRTSTTPPPPPRCTVTHAEPAVVFSIGGYTGNLFHDFTDVLVPLYGAAQRYRGHVRLVVADAAGRSPWLAKYAAVLRALSRHPPLDLANTTGEVHCFGHVVVGLRAHRELMVDPPERSNHTDGIIVGMPDFARFLRRALSLPRNAVPDTDTNTKNKRKRPRLLIVARRGTRRLVNTDAVARAAEEVGFEAVVRDLDTVGGRDVDGVAEVGRVINAFDAMVGVHGAGLTNMVFLPRGATVVQVVPWGGLQWIARMDFGDPAQAMGLRYVQYEIAVHESSLAEKYPRDHEVFTNPTALHRKGFKFLRHTFLIGQDVTIDVDRFRVVLLQAFRNLTTS